MAEHTPTPWHTGSTEHTELVMGFKDNSECVLAELDTDDVPMEETAANAAFIVKAVNNHAMLVAAIQAIKQATIDGKVCDDVAWFDTITTLHDFCDQTLAIVTGDDLIGVSKS